jgi:hypothetical protein
MMRFAFVGMLPIDVLYLYATLLPFQRVDVLSLMFGILLSYL